MNQDNPFDILANFGSNSETFLLVGAPVSLLLVVAFIFVMLIRIRRRREANLLTSDEVKKITVSAGTKEQIFDGSDSKQGTSLKNTEPAPATSIKIPEPIESGWLTRLHQGLKRTRDQLQEGLSQLFSGNSSLEGEALEELRELLFRADLGVSTTEKLVAHLIKEVKSGEKPDHLQIQSLLGAKISEILSASISPITTPSEGPQVILIVGVNGVGKTTTVAKLASYYKELGKTVLLCAADTFRAAAIEQLEAWSKRIDVPLIRHQANSDPAAVTFDAVKAAKARQADVLLIDTAGRLHNKLELMEELAKIRRVIAKELPGAPHETWLVVDAVTGQNAIQQVKVFKEIVQLTGIVVTKLDGTAKGGVVVGISDTFQLPIRFVGVGEGMADLREFDPIQFAKSLV
jgi:fused signal recognition particle receptor